MQFDHEEFQHNYGAKVTTFGKITEDQDKKNIPGKWHNTQPD